MYYNLLIYFLFFIFNKKQKKTNKTRLIKEFKIYARKKIIIVFPLFKIKMRYMKILLQNKENNNQNKTENTIIFHYSQKIDYFT